MAVAEAEAGAGAGAEAEAEAELEAEMVSDRARARAVADAARVENQQKLEARGASSICTGGGGGSNCRIHQHGEKVTPFRAHPVVTLSKCSVAVGKEHPQTQCSAAWNTLYFATLPTSRWFGREVTLSWILTFSTIYSFSYLSMQL